MGILLGLLLTFVPLLAWSAETRPAQPMDSPHIVKMADAMTRMAEMCETMMKKEMAARPFKMIASVLLVLLLIVDLALLAVLQVQWIKHWTRTLQVEGPT